MNPNFGRFRPEPSMLEHLVSQSHPGGHRDIDALLSIHAHRAAGYATSAVRVRLASRNITRAALHDFKESVPVHANDLYRIYGAIFGGGVQEPLLIDTDAAHPLKAGRTIDNWARAGSVIAPRNSI